MTTVYDKTDNYALKQQSQSATTNTPNLTESI